MQFLVVSSFFDSDHVFWSCVNLQEKKDNTLEYDKKDNESKAEEETIAVPPEEALNATRMIPQYHGWAKKVQVSSLGTKEFTISSQMQCEHFYK